MVNRFNVDQAVEARWGAGKRGAAWYNGKVTGVFELSEEEGGPGWIQYRTRRWRYGGKGSGAECSFDYLSVFGVLVFCAS